MSKSSKIQWQVFAFPYSSSIQDLSGTTPASFDTGPVLDITRGSTSITYNRSKSNPESQCQISYVGRPNDKVVLGTWIVVVSSFKGTDSKVPRFIGQISGLSTDYITEASGLKHRVTRYQIREWSSALTVPVRFDLSVLSDSSPLFLALSNTNILGSAVAIAKAYGIENILADQSQSLSAYDMAIYILTLVGAFSEQSVAKPVLGAVMPAVPKSIIDFLGILPVSGKKYNPAAPYATGLVNTVTGFFDTSGGTGSYNNKTKTHPSVSGYGFKFTEGNSVWGLLNQLCNPVLNEVFTDLVYTPDDSGNWIAQPTIYVRCKPFSLRPPGASLISTITGNYEIERSYYDDVPITPIDPEYIVSARVSYSLDNSPTYFRVLPIPDDVSNQSRNQITSQISGTKSLQNEMFRFGGREQGFTTSYISQGTLLPGSAVPFDPQKWCSSLATLMSQWYGKNYLLPEMTLALKDENIPFSIGSNVSFTLNGIVLVGHLEAYSCSVQVAPNGQKTSNSSIQLSRVMTYDEFGNLAYLPENSLSQLFIG